jgi:hypothetical protein
VPGFWRSSFMNRGAGQPLFARADDRPYLDIAIDRRRTSVESGNTKGSVSLVRTACINNAFRLLRSSTRAGKLEQFICYRVAAIERALD